MTTELASQSSTVHVVPRTNLPSEPPPNPGIADVKPFTAHELFRRVLPTGGAVSMSWIGARIGECVTERSNATQTLLLVLGGSARLSGHSTKRVKEGDVVTVPAGSKYGFTDVGIAGLDVLEVTFAAGAAPRKAGSLAELLARNAELAERSKQQPFFRLLEDGTLNDPKKRARFFDCLQVFSDAFQTVLMTRQATCREERFTKIFSSHFREELGHNDLLARERVPNKVNDPILTATVTWFCRQMLVLDNAEKAVLVHLVLETAGHHFHTIAKNVFARDKTADYFAVHSEADDDHSNVATGLLVGLSETNYARLSHVLESSWDMFDTMGNRIARLTAAEGAS